MEIVVRFRVSPVYLEEVDTSDKSAIWSVLDLLDIEDIQDVTVIPEETDK